MTNKTIDILGFIVTIIVGLSIVFLLVQYFDLPLITFFVLGILLRILGREITK